MNEEVAVIAAGGAADIPPCAAAVFGSICHFLKRRASADDIAESAENGASALLQLNGGYLVSVYLHFVCVKRSDHIIPGAQAREPFGYFPVALIRRGIAGLVDGIEVAFFRPFGI